MKLLAVLIKANYEFIRDGSSGGREESLVGLTLADNEEDAKRIALTCFTHLNKKRSLFEGQYSNLKVEEVQEINLNQRTFLGRIILHRE